MTASSCSIAGADVPGGCSRGGVKVSTGGDGEQSHEPAGAWSLCDQGSRFGENPEPTVGNLEWDSLIVRMYES